MMQGVKKSFKKFGKKHILNEMFAKIFVFELKKVDFGKHIPWVSINKWVYSESAYIIFQGPVIHEMGSAAVQISLKRLSQLQFELDSIQEPCHNCD